MSEISSLYLTSMAAQAGLSLLWSRTPKTWLIYYACETLLRTGQEVRLQSKKISNDQELIQSDPTSCPQNQKGNN